MLKNLRFFFSPFLSFFLNSQLFPILFRAALSQKLANVMLWYYIFVFFFPPQPLSNFLFPQVTDKIRRTSNFMLALAFGVPIVSSRWIEDSQKAKKWVFTFSFFDPMAFFFISLIILFFPLHFFNSSIVWIISSMIK